MNGIRKLLVRVKGSGSRRTTTVTTVSMGRERIFDAFDIGNDTFILERGIHTRLCERPSVLVVKKSDLRNRARGYVLTISSGNHSVSAFPLLDGRFWKLSTLKGSKRGETLMNRVLCANVVSGKLELSQRELTTARLVEVDDWLLSTAGLGMDDVVMGERNDATLDHYRRRGQDWRVKPLAWTESEMKVALAASTKRISSSILYYHSMKGVHFLVFSEFERFVSRAETDFEAFVSGLRELVAVFEGNTYSFTRMAKHRGHHEVEFFGLKRGQALETLVPRLEQLMEEIVLGRLGQLDVIQKAQEITALFRSLLTRPEFADETSAAFVDTLYMHITGEIYAVASEGTTPAFDDRRTPLPGATFVDGRLTVHPGTDARTEVLLSNLRGMLSKGELIEYANVYELRGSGEYALGSGVTREVVYKTNMRPLEASLIEKGLSSRRLGYGEYVLARVGALRAMGVSLSTYYRLLRRRPTASKSSADFYVRMRCEGETLDSIPASYFRGPDDSGGEDREFVLCVAALMGDAAAQNMAMKKFDPETSSPLYGVGKEIYDFEYDLVREQVIPKKVSTCSVRGSFGWPDLSFTEENLQKIGAFYLACFAHALKDFQRRHSLPIRDLAERFLSGFEFRTHAMAWQLSVMRDQFEAFRPPVRTQYGFDRKWRFVMWSLERQERRIPLMRKLFLEKLGVAD